MCFFGSELVVACGPKPLTFTGFKVCDLVLEFGFLFLYIFFLLWIKWDVLNFFGWNWNWTWCIVEKKWIFLCALHIISCSAQLHWCFHSIALSPRIYYALKTELFSLFVCVFKSVWICVSVQLERSANKRLLFDIGAWDSWKLCQPEQMQGSRASEIHADTFTCMDAPRMQPRWDAQFPLVHRGERKTCKRT